MPSLLESGGEARVMDHTAGHTVTAAEAARPPCQYLALSELGFDFDSTAVGNQHDRFMATDTGSAIAESSSIFLRDIDRPTPDCASCGTPILDRYLLKVCDGHWHEQCLTCSVCGARLSQSPSCYVRDGKIFCKIDYKRIFGTKCGRCMVPLNSSDVVQRTTECVYHAACFACLFCGQLLQPGDEFVVSDGQLICRIDYESMMQNPFGPGFSLAARMADHRKTPKRPRTILTSQQRKAFKASFELSAKPCRKVRETLAKETGLSVRVVQVWFQNQRAKMKKLQRKQEQNSQKRSSSSSAGDGEKRSLGDKDGESTSSRKATGIGSPASSSIDSSSDELDMSSSPGLLDICDKNSEARRSSDDMNPIHKLYSMQDSYFNF